MYRVTESGNKYFAVEINIKDEYAQEDIITLLAEDNEVILIDDIEVFEEINGCEVEVVE